jgi:hypothetical protein
VRGAAKNFPVHGSHAQIYAALVEATKANIDARLTDTQPPDTTRVPTFRGVDYRHIVSAALQIWPHGHFEAMLIGYMRVSKSDGSQILDLQKDTLLAAVVAPDRIYKDLASGRKDDRPGLRACLKALQPGNTLVVWKLDRLGRDLKHLITTVDDLNKRDVGFKVLAGAGAQID